VCIEIGLARAVDVVAGGNRIELANRQITLAV
jgi:hypothetical protein